MVSHEILEKIRTIYDSGETQESIAKRMNVAQPIIARLLSGKRSPEGLKLGTVDRMFPQATINFVGNTATNGGKIASDNNFFAPSEKPDAKPTIAPELIAEAMKGMSPEEKARFLKELSK